MRRHAEVGGLTQFTSCTSSPVSTPCRRRASSSGDRSMSRSPPEPSRSGFEVRRPEPDEPRVPRARSMNTEQASMSASRRSSSSTAFAIEARRERARSGSPARAASNACSSRRPTPGERSPKSGSDSSSKRLTRGEPPAPPGDGRFSPPDEPSGRSLFPDRPPPSGWPDRSARGTAPRAR